jgi:hypothetical protein
MFLFDPSYERVLNPPPPFLYPSAIFYPLKPTILLHILCIFFVLPLFHHLYRYSIKYTVYTKTVLLYFLSLYHSFKPWTNSPPILQTVD